MDKMLNDLQARMLEMMKWFHQYCAENNIPYYMIGGTMLGAIRHHGFIPWDDDIDVGVPRREYNRLLSIAKTLTLDTCPYVIESYHDGNDDFEYPYAKVYDTSTTLIENKRKKPKRGVFIDVFPLDGIGTSMNDALKNFKPIGRNLDMLATRSCAVRKGRAGIKNLVVRIVGVLPPFILNPRKLMKRIDELCEYRDFDEYEYVGNMVGIKRTKELMPRSTFGKPTLYRFEDAEFYGVSNYDDYLTRLYNNWRLLPPPEKQKSEHDFTDLDLNRSYMV